MRIISSLAVALICSLVATPTSRDYGRSTVIWDVGQGQWGTMPFANECWHFDVGGERAPAKAIAHLCGRKRQRLQLSHWDWDHIGFSHLLARLGPTCLESRPGGLATPKKRARFANWPPCDRAPGLVKIYSPRDSRSANGASQVYSVGRWLIPGDSPTREERSWVARVPGSTSHLLLGHHGSKTSTGDSLIRQLPQLRQAVASANPKRYGHPHWEVQWRLRRAGVALVTTADWGSMWFVEAH